MIAAGSFRLYAILLLIPMICGCAMRQPKITRVPAVEYSNRLRLSYAAKEANPAGGSPASGFQSPARGDQGAMMQVEEPRARVRLVAENSQEQDDVAKSSSPQVSADGSAADVVTNLNSQGQAEPSFKVYESQQPDIRDYNGPLSLGDPGLSASLWKESKGGSALFRDYRAWQPMDLITILVTETSEGKKEADTEIKQKSTVEAAIEYLLGLEDKIPKNKSTKDIDPKNMISASTTNDFKGEGETNRKGTLKAKISAMVVEVLPSGVLRIEGEKIVSVNAEDEVMVISGLARPEDVNSSNEIDSAKIANMRIDYYGNGTVGEAQFGGWASRLMRLLWPF